MATFYANYPSVESAGGSGGNSAAGPTGAPVPGDADYIGFSVGGTLTGVSAATPLPVTIESGVGDLNVNIAEYGGVATSLGQKTSAASQPVVIASDQSAVPISAASLPLPAGAATSANQTTEITALGTINTTLGSPFQAGGSIGNTSFIATQTTGTNLHTVVDNFPATQPVSGTVAVSNFPATQPVSGTVTANQGTSPWVTSVSGTVGVTQSTSPWVVSGTVSTSNPVNANGSFTGSLSVTTTEASTAAPANAVGVVFEAESGNATNIRWGVSNSASTILSTSSGVLMEPGRSIDFLPIGFGTYLHYISTAAGTNTIDIQWVLSS